MFVKWVWYFDARTKISKLKQLILYLIFSNNKIGDEGGQVLAETLKSFTHIIHLKILIK